MDVSHNLHFGQLERLMTNLPAILDGVRVMTYIPAKMGGMRDIHKSLISAKTDAMRDQWMSIITAFPYNSYHDMIYQFGPITICAHLR